MVKAFELGDLVVWRYDHAEGAEVFRGDVGIVIPLDSDDAQGVVRIAPKIWRGYKAPSATMRGRTPRSWYTLPQHIRHAGPLEVLLYG